MSRKLLLIFSLMLVSPLFANASMFANREYKQHYDQSCTVLWPHVVDILQNDGKYTVSSIHEKDQTVIAHAGNKGDGQKRIELNISLSNIIYTGATIFSRKEIDGCNLLIIGAKLDALNEPDDFEKKLTASLGSSPAMNAAPVGAGMPAMQNEMPLPAGDALVSVTVTQRCKRDPDPLGLLPGRTTFYSKCKIDELNNLRASIVQGLKARNVAVAEANQPAPIQLVVTLTLSQWVGGMTDFSAGTMHFAAEYQINGGGSSTPGTVTYEEKGTDKHAEERFGNKLAAEVAGKLGPLANHPAAAQATGTPAQPQYSPANTAAPAVRNQTQLPAGDAAVGVTVTQRCEKDPNPSRPEFLNNYVYFKCDALELDQLRTSIVQGLKSRNVTVADANQPAPIQLAVTLTRSMVVGGAFSASMHFAAEYQISSGGSSTPGTVEYEEKGTDKNAQDKFGDKLAAEVAGKLGSVANHPAAAQLTGTPAQPQYAPVQPQSAPLQPQSAVDVAALDAYYKIVADAYQSLPNKPVLPDDARNHKRLAEAAVEKLDAGAAVAEYTAALNSAPWWSEGMKWLAWAYAKSNDYRDAIIWMKRYLNAQPSDEKAAQMQELMEGWKLWAPEQQPPNLDAPAGTHSGVIVRDLPGVVAQAMNDPNMEGALIILVLNHSVAQKAGIQAGDVVTAVDGKPVHAGSDLLAAIANAQAGSVARFTLHRKTETLTLDVTFPSAAPPASSPRAPAGK